MHRFSKSLTLLVLLGLLGVQVHVAFEHFSAPPGPLAVRHRSAQDSGQQPGQHLCAVCMAGIWATLSALPQLGFAPATSLRRMGSLAVCDPTSFSEVSSSRAPPLA
jgi:hypothetical protein